MSKNLLNQIQRTEETRGLTFRTYMEVDKNKTIRMGYKPFDRGYLSFLSHFTEFEDEAKNKRKSSANTSGKVSQKSIIVNHLDTN